MKVYVLTKGERGEGLYIVGVYASRALARRDIPRETNQTQDNDCYWLPNGVDYYMIEVFDLSVKTRSPLKDLAFKILDGDPQAVDAAKDVLARGGIEA